jgi:hypothetical protein
MRRAATWAASLVVGLAAVAGLVALINSRDPGGLSPKASQSAAPGAPYRGEPVLSPADEDAVKRGNVLVLYRDANPPPGTRALVPPGGRELERLGQSVVLDREPTLHAPLAAVSKKRLELADKPQELQEFIDYWLGS